MIGFILFGFGKQITEDFGGTTVYLCKRCNNARVWHFLKISSWFTVFFMPIFSYKTSYSLKCPICNHNVSLTKDQFEEQVKSQQHTVTV